MRTIAILPIKSFGAAKQRLSGLLGSGSRQALAQAMFQDVLTSLRRVPSIDAIVVITSNPVAEQAARGENVLLLRDEPETGHVEAAMLGIDHAIETGYERALLVPGDTPLLDPSEVEAMLERAERESTAVVVVPDRHGTGTNALLLTPPTAITPAFGPGSCERHRGLAASTGSSCEIEALPSLVLDVDTPEDLAELAAAMEGCHGQASITRGALRQLDRSRASQPSGEAQTATAAS